MRGQVTLLVMFALVMGTATQPVSAWVQECDPLPCVPPGASVISATFSIYVNSFADSPTVQLHRITEPWVETLVTWNNFGGAFDGAVESSFVADGTGWRSADVTSLVQGWVDGTYPNYGILLEQGQTDYTSYVSSESSVWEWRPKLEICFATSNGPICITIQRCPAENIVVADAYIWEPAPNANGGNSTVLYTGLISIGEKQSLIRFEFEICDQPCGCRFTGGGVDTDGNWDHSLENGEMIRNGAGSVPEGVDRAQFGGQAGANTALPPQPAGEWTHHQQRGPSGRFTFHGGTASAPAGTEIDEIRCSDPGGCKPSGNPPSPAKQLDFDGIGTFKSIGKGGNAPVFEIPANATAEGKGNKTFDGTFHWFEVNIDDLGEPGGMNSGAPDSAECPSIGFGEKGAEELANCDCPDFYRIVIYDGVDAADVTWIEEGVIDPASLNTSDVIYEFYGYIDGGNLQIHHLTGYDGDTPCF
jgi:hypothetical protein